uniref:Uncharacterized protein n=1 Tax=Candidatus Kentrum sp. LFY TaxID=2126342 RepID=A0A450UG82_9GAMM|nr:MAG: hypothetical protein BECKLFY1418B_GA0070995_102625 [Candidatus Kentron sp. LFY]
MTPRGWCAADMDRDRSIAARTKCPSGKRAALESGAPSGGLFRILPRNSETLFFRYVNMLALCARTEPGAGPWFTRRDLRFSDASSICLFPARLHDWIEFYEALLPPYQGSIMLCRFEAKLRWRMPEYRMVVWPRPEDSLPAILAGFFQEVS